MPDLAVLFWPSLGQYSKTSYSQFHFTFHRVILKFARNYRSIFLSWEIGPELRNEFANFTANSQRGSSELRFKQVQSPNLKTSIVTCNTQLIQNNIKQIKYNK